MTLRRRLSWLAAGATAACALAAAGGLVRAGEAGHAGHGAGASGAASAFEQAMDRGMARMMTDMHAPGYSGDPDVDFLQMMVPHHQGAVEMARLVLLHGRDPATRQLAEDIIAGQTVEIESMQRRLAHLRGDDCTTAPEFPSLGGTRGAAPNRAPGVAARPSSDRP